MIILHSRLSPQNPDNFNLVLDLYRLGRFHVSEAGCALVLQRTIQYWRVDELWIESCCSLKYFPQLDVCQNEKSGDIEAKKLAEEKPETWNAKRAAGTEAATAALKRLHKARATELLKVMIQPILPKWIMQW